MGFPNLTATGISLDQYLAEKWNGLAPIPSLQVGVGITQNRETVACISWNAALQPQPAENNPFAAFARLFPNGSGEPNADLQRVIAARMSILPAAPAPAPAARCTSACRARASTASATQVRSRSASTRIPSRRTHTGSRSEPRDPRRTTSV